MDEDVEEKDLEEEGEEEAEEEKEEDMRTNRPGDSEEGEDGEG